MAQNLVSDSSRIEFAQNLRGIAATCVVIHHIFILFWFSNPVTQIYTGLPLYTGVIPLISQWFNKIQTVNFGAFGVAIFFMISGFVMPNALQKQGRSQFLVGRFFRIWPVYVTGLMVSLLSLWIASRYFNVGFVPTPKTILASLFISPHLLSMNSIDGVIWTLEIEIKFYMLITFFPMVTRGNIKIPLLFAVFFALFATMFVTKSHHASIAKLMYEIQTNGMFFSFMFLGSLFHFLHKKKINLRQFIIGTAILLSLFTYQRFINLYQYPFSSADFYAYFAGFALFGGCYFSQNKIKFPRFFDALAKISYPLYACHAIFGYVYLRMFLTKWNDPTVALLSYLFFVCLMSYAIHRVVEIPSNRIGKMMGKKISNYFIQRSIELTPNDAAAESHPI